MTFMPLNGTVDDEVKVLRLVLKRVGIGPKQVIHSLTFRADLSDDFLVRSHVVPKLLDETLVDFLAKNKESHPVEPAFTLNGSLRPMGLEEEYRLLFGQDLKGFQDNLPESHGIIGFSRVGFDAKLTQAFVVTQISEGSLQTEVVHWLGARSHKSWEVMKIYGYWSAF